MNKWYWMDEKLHYSIDGLYTRCSLVMHFDPEVFGDLFETDHQRFSKVICQECKENI